MAVCGCGGGALWCCTFGFLGKLVAIYQAIAPKYTRFTQIRHVSPTRQVMVGKSETLVQVPAVGLSYTTLGASPNRKVAVLGVSSKTTTIRNSRKTIVLRP